jgi:hypothetical protein
LSHCGGQLKEKKEMNSAYHLFFFGSRNVIKTRFERRISKAKQQRAFLALLTLAFD